MSVLARNLPSLFDAILSTEAKFSRCTKVLTTKGGQTLYQQGVTKKWPVNLCSHC